MRSNTSCPAARSGSRHRMRKAWCNSISAIPASGLSRKNRRDFQRAFTQVHDTRSHGLGPGLGNLPRAYRAARGRDRGAERGGRARRDLQREASRGASAAAGNGEQRLRWRRNPPRRKSRCGCCWWRTMPIRSARSSSGCSHRNGVYQQDGDQRGRSAPCRRGVPIRCACKRHWFAGRERAGFDEAVTCFRAKQRRPWDRIERLWNAGGHRQEPERGFRLSFHKAGGHHSSFARR